MCTTKFKTNFVSLLNLFKTPEELCDFLVKKESFNDQFIKNITESDYLQKLKNIDSSLNIIEIQKRLNYEVGYNELKKKIKVDITKNDIFSYLDSEEQLIEKMKYYIKYEDYEKASVLCKYFDTIDLKYQ